jgi:nucleoside-diphosphate-sugar epimerase
VEDIVEGLYRCAVHGSPGEVYNLGSGHETKIKDLAAIINELTGNPTPPILLPPRDWDRSGRRFASTKKSEKLLGFRAQTDIRTGLEKTVQWTIDHRGAIASSIANQDRFMKMLE